MSILEKYIKWIASFIMIVSISMILLNVFYRYILLGLLVDYFGEYDFIMSCVDYLDIIIGDIIVTSDEIPGFLLIWISFLGAFMAIRDPGHINFDLLINKFSDTVKRAFLTINYSLIIVFFLMFLYLSIQMIQIDGATEIETAEISQGYFMLIFPIASVLFIIGYFEQILKLLKRK